MFFKLDIDDIIIDAVASLSMPRKLHKAISVVLSPAQHN
jgi:hypothetical protein